MPLPHDWADVDWRPTVIILPEATEGIRTLPLNRDHHPEHGRAYFMMATTDGNGPLVHYNAAEVGTAGELASQFVFWHEMAHFHLGHVQHVPAIREPVEPSGNREIDCDRLAFEGWVRQGAHGRKVIRAIMGYLRGLPNVGDHDHPPPRDRANHLQHLLEQRPWGVWLYNDDSIPGEYVLHLLQRDFGMAQDKALQTMQVVEANGVGLLGTTTLDDAERRVGDVLNDARPRGYHALRLDLHPA